MEIGEKSAIFVKPQFSCGNSVFRNNPNTRSSTGQKKRMVKVSNVDLISVSESANTAFDGFDWNEHEGKGVRLFVQGFG